MKKKIFPILSILLLISIVILITLISGIIKRYTPSKELADQGEYYSMTEAEDVGLVLQNQVSGTTAKIFDGVLYLDINTVSDNLNDHFYWDANENVLLYTTPTDVVKAEVGSKDYYVSKTKNSENYQIVKTVGDKAYVAIDFVQKYTNMEYLLSSSPSRVNITYQWGETTYADVKKETQVRLKGGIKSAILTTVSKSDKVTVLDQEDSWTKILTNDGYIGYVKKSKLSENYKETTSREFEVPVYKSIAKDYTINMVWHQVDSTDDNGKLLEAIADTKGVTTVSPTWFKLSDNEGNISSLASTSYVNYAHQLDIEVWGLVSNFVNEIDTNSVLSYTSKRENLTNQLIAAAIQYDLDGINLDFEQLDQESGDSYIQFVRELSIKCRNNGIVLSVDNYVPTDYTAFYNRAAQAEVADYIVIMGYDEHYDGSEEGSVSSLSFVKNGVLDTVKEVPAEKVIMGIPFYTRIWIETPTGEETYDLTSQAVGMSTVNQIISDYGLTPTWDDATGQYYFEYEGDGKTYKCWMEDSTSIEAKLKIMKENYLGGIAAWKLGLETTDIWDTIIKYVN